MIDSLDKIIDFLDNLGLAKIVADKKKLMLAVLISLAFIFLDVSFVLKMQLSGFSALGPKITKLKNDLSSLDRDLQKMQSLKNKDSNEKQKGIVKAKKIISQNQVTTLLQDISEIAKSNNIRITQIKHFPDAAGTKQVGSEKLLPFLISLDLTCDFHTLGKFINQLENDEIILSVQDLHIVPAEANALIEKVTITLRTYVRK